jgi:serpin B
MTEPTRSGRRVKRRTLWLGATAVAVVVAVSSISISLSGGPSDNKATPPTDSPTGPTNGVHLDSAVELTGKHHGAVATSGADESDISSAEQKFSLGLLQQLVGSSSSNVLVSPLSLDEALSMTLLSARGATADQIAGVLRVSGMSPQVQAAGWASLDHDLAASSSEDRISLEDANSLWTQTGLPVEQAYLDAIESQFGAGVWQVNFDNDPDAAARAVNDWVDYATEGQIPTLLNSQDIPASTAFVILNAVYFEAQWARQLLDTEPGQFQSPSGSIPVTYMSAQGDDDLDASIGSGLDAVELPYWNGSGSAGGHIPGRYAALLLMPTSGSLARFVSTLDSSTLNRITSALTSQLVDLEIPEVDIDSNLDLSSTLGSMGMSDAFGPGADFSAMSNLATQLSEVKQKATLHVTKYGTVASAATSIVGIASAAMKSVPLTFDRPFVFMVRDTVTGTILFESAVDNPVGGS